jgi:hypothetical protein
MKTNKQQQKAKQKPNKRYQNLKNNKQKRENKIQKLYLFIVYAMCMYFINFSLKVYVALK